MSKPTSITTIVTYGELNRVLAALGFRRKEVDGFVVFHEAAHDAKILLPLKDRRTRVGAPYFVAIRNTVAGKGIASASQLEALFEASRRPHASAYTADPSICADEPAHSQ